MPEDRRVITTGQITLIDIDDVGDIIVKPTEPNNPVEGSIWLNTSGEPPYRFYTYSGGQWRPTDYESLEELDPEQFTKLLETHAAITNLDDDGKLTRYERSIVRQEVATITGKTLSPTEAMPTISEIDAGEAGELYALRQEAREAEIDTGSQVYTRTERAYNDLKNYLSGLTPKAWDIKSAEVTSISGTMWDTVWNEYKVAYNSLRVAVTVKQEQDRKELQNNIGEVTEEVERVEKRVQEAEVKIKPDNIVSTVRESVQYQNDMDPETIVSRINQDARNITFDAERINMNGKLTIRHFNPDLAEEFESKATKEEAQKYAESAESKAKEYADARKVTSPTEPADRSVIWIDTSNPSNPLWKVWDENQKKWILGPGGPKGDKGDTGERGPTGPAGTGVSGVTEYYLATSASSGVTTGTSGWTTTMQQMTATNKYLWNYEKITFTDGSSQTTSPVIIGVYGDRGQAGATGATGRSITGITEYYLATSASSGVTRSTSGWTTTMQTTTPSNKYLWNYEVITWSSAPTTTYVEPVIIGVHGNTGPQGPQGIQGPAGKNGTSQYVHIRYSANSNGSSMTTTPQTNSKYIGIANTTSSTAPTSNTAYTWALIKGADGSQGAQGVPGPAGKDGQPTYTWVKYADDNKGTGMSDSPDGKLYIGLAFNKTTPTESNTASQYTWSLMPQNIEIGGRNLVTMQNVVNRNSGDFIREGYSISFTHRGAYEGFTITNMRDFVELGVPHILSFKVKKNSGTFQNIGGHVDTAQIRIDRWYIDGKQISNSFISAYSEPTLDDGEWHDIEIHFVRHVDAEGDGTGTTNRLTPQPNRGLATQVNVTVEDIQLERGTQKTGWGPALGDIQDELNEKAQNDDLENLAEIITDVGSEVGNKTDIADFEALQEEFNQRIEQDILDKEQLEADLATLEGRTALVEILAGESKLVSEFIETIITQSEEGIFVGNKGKDNGILISENRISFVDNGVEVAYISNQTMEITHGIFVESATIGGFRFERIPGTETLAITWSG